MGQYGTVWEDNVFVGGNGLVIWILSDPRMCANGWWKYLVRPSLLHLNFLHTSSWGGQLCDSRGTVDPCIFFL